MGVGGDGAGVLMGVKRMEVEGHGYYGMEYEDGKRVQGFCAHCSIGRYSICAIAVNNPTFPNFCHFGMTS